jgi:hypothetical protein
MNKGVVRMLVRNLVILAPRGAGSQSAERQAVDAHCVVMQALDQALDIHPGLKIC